MKVEKIIGLCKKSGVLRLYAGATEGEQWISDGYAMFPLLNLPIFDEETICRAYDISEKKAEKMLIKYELHLPSRINIENDTPDEIPCEIGDELLGGAIPITTSRGMMFIHRKYLQPFNDTPEELLYIFERQTSDGQTYFVVKIGFILSAIVMPYDCVNEAFVERLKNAYEQCKIALANKTEAEKAKREREAEE